MKKIETSNPEYYLLVDHYPYEETKEELRYKFSSWFDYKKERNLDVSNYDLDSTNGNSLLTSLEWRLREGNFSFLYKNDVCLCFAALQMRDGCAWIHRLFTNPTDYIKHLGTISQYLLPFQIKTAREHGCHTYKLTYTGRNSRFYNFYKNKKFLRSKFYKSDTISGVENISKFDFVGTEIVNQTPQLVAKLDLNRPDIEDFCKF